jgi:hypothetical protein
MTSVTNSIVHLLTPASHGLRAIAPGSELPWADPAIQLFYLVVFVLLVLKACFEVE